MPAINYIRAGTGEPLILIHGTGSRIQTWDPIFGDLARHCDVIAVDLPGFGKSDAPSGSPIDTLPDAVAELITELNLDRPHVVGNSIGGSVALTLGARGLTRSVTALSPAGFWGTPGRIWFQAAMRFLDGLGTLIRPALPVLMATPATRTLLFGLVVGRPWRLDPQIALDDAYGVLDSPGLKSLMNSLRRYRMTGLDGLAEMPVTIVWGTRDHLLTYSTQSRAARKLLPHSRFISIKGCGHIPFYDDPARVTAIILEQLGQKDKE